MRHSLNTLYGTQLQRRVVYSLNRLHGRQHQHAVLSTASTRCIGHSLIMVYESQLQYDSEDV